MRALILTVVRRVELRIIDRLAGFLPTLDAVAHHAYVGVSCSNRPPGGFMRRRSMQVGAVKNQLRTFAGRQFFRDIVLVVAGQQMRARNDAGGRPQSPTVSIIYVHVRIRIVHQRRQFIDPDNRELVRCRLRVVDQLADIKSKRRGSHRENDSPNYRSEKKALRSNMHTHTISVPKRPAPAKIKHWVQGSPLPRKRETTAVSHSIK